MTTAEERYEKTWNSYLELLNKRPRATLTSFTKSKSVYHHGMTNRCRAMVLAYTTQRQKSGSASARLFQTSRCAPPAFHISISSLRDESISSIVDEVYL